MAITTIFRATTANSVHKRTGSLMTFPPAFLCFSSAFQAGPPCLSACLSQLVKSPLTNLVPRYRRGHLGEEKLVMELRPDDREACDSLLRGVRGNKSISRFFAYQLVGTAMNPIAFLSCQLSYGGRNPFRGQREPGGLPFFD